MIRTLQLLANLFPVWVFIGGIVAYVYPPAFTWYSRPMIIWGLAIIMLGMGITLSFEDFRKVFQTPRPIFLGVVAQFTIMPFLGWSIAHGMQLERDFAVGLILVSCCPGGTASNVVTYIARANLALSVLMTMCSTLAAIMMTPLLTKALAGEIVPVDAWGLFRSTVQVVLLPVVLGLFCHHLFPKTVQKIIPVSPLISVIVIVLICGSIIGNNAEAIRAAAGKLLTAVLLLHVFGFGLGYGIAKVFGYESQIRRTVSIEVGMQNSGLGAALAEQHFNTLTAAPCSVSSVFHSVIGSILAGIWRNRIAPKPDNPANEVVSA